jgi:hypothetical protein
MVVYCPQHMDGFSVEWSSARDTAIFPAIIMAPSSRRPIADRGAGMNRKTRACVALSVFVLIVLWSVFIAWCSGVNGRGEGLANALIFGSFIGAGIGGAIFGSGELQ